MKNVLLDRGIILPSGEINKDKINLVAGVCITNQTKKKTGQNKKLRFGTTPLLKRFRIAVLPLDKLLYA